MRAAAGTKPGEAVEPQVWCEGWTLPGAFWIDQEGPALETARNWRAEGTIWTDGSQLDSGGWGGMRMEGSGGLNRQAFPPRDQQGSFRR